MERVTLNPKSLFDPRAYGFSQVVIADPGKMVFISGQVACDEQFNVVGENDLAIQTQKAIDNLEIAIEAAGGTLENIVMLRIYKVNYQAGDGGIINKVLKSKFGTDNPPASTWLGISGLVDKRFMIEIEAQAVV